MKKLTLNFSILFLMLSTINVLAQDSHVAILLNNVNSRLNYGDMNGSLRDFKKDLRGIQAGLSWQAGVTKHFSIVTEAYFVKKGGVLTTGNPLNGEKSSLKLFTAELPVLARIHAGRFYFNAGPYLNHIFSGRNSTETEGSKSVSFGNQAGSLRHWEAGLQAGAGYQFSVKKTRMALDVRYTHGLTSISKSEELNGRTINISILVLRSWKRLG